MVAHCLLHALGATIFAGCTYYDTHVLFLTDPDDPHHHVVKQLAFERDRLGGRWKYLTIWGLTCQLVYYCLAVVNDLFGSNTFDKSKVTKLQKIRDVFFTSIALPVGMLVSIMFWGVFVVDRELVFPAILDAHYPALLNHGVHTMPLLIGLLEVALERHNYACNRLSLGLLLGFLATYLGWTLHLALVENLWVYGILRVLSWPMRVAFMGVNLLIGVCLFFLGKGFDNFVWGNEKALAQVDSTKKRR
ncbi:androgen-induced gene 1 protein-like isoform X2 [Amphibalanus amphitrite]|nr:androgen-induced gene 1 protein-like isoform X2 [Amphibalanus amphitrite]XP_043205899.1 androgen-induced gene 1 protein-like isoform X2 [Amphibalanus amphitrite]XP_043205900.1 androgen-induced gene 1 protein-like isoform X2 [Amphibalanus amphitrite]XP_043205901.1 androgen-induced gene 1 protein-like isoform X2 [Amphibalanus amphitrite]XP_043205902.1 androgen-induced gene 1 protein-like isoform X2 [Amphibalanus amphitrite]